MDGWDVLVLQVRVHKSCDQQVHQPFASGDSRKIRIILLISMGSDRTYLYFRFGFIINRVISRFINHLPLGIQEKLG